MKEFWQAVVSSCPTTAAFLDRSGTRFVMRFDIADTDACESHRITDLEKVVRHDRQSERHVFSPPKVASFSYQRVR